MVITTRNGARSKRKQQKEAVAENGDFNEPLLESLLDCLFS